MFMEMDPQDSFHKISHTLFINYVLKLYADFKLKIWCLGNCWFDHKD